MRLKVEQVKNHLTKSSLLPVYLVSGDEPLQRLEVADLIRSSTKQQGFEERIVLEVDKQFDWQRLLDEASALSLFSSLKLIELKMGSAKPGREGGKMIAEFLQQVNEGVVLLITCDRLDKSAQSTKWFKSIDKAGAVIMIWPIEYEQLPHWIIQRAKAAGKKIDRNAAELISTRVEGNLIAAAQEISKLCLLVESDQITLEDVVQSVVDSSRYDVFKLIESAYNGEIERTGKMLRGLRSEGLDPMAVYGAVIWDYRRLCKMLFDQKHSSFETLFAQYRIWNESRKRAIRSIQKRHSLENLHVLLIQADKLDQTIKSTNRNYAWNELLEFLLQVAGKQKHTNTLLASI